MDVSISMNVQWGHIIVPSLDNVSTQKEGVDDVSMNNSDIILSNSYIIIFDDTH